MTRALEPSAIELLDGDQVPGQDVPINWETELEIGRTGLKRAAGYVNEEFLPQLRGRKGIQVYREMAENDPIVGSLLFALKRLMSEVDWNVEPADTSRAARADADFVEQCRDDMTESWSSFVMELLSSLEYGWAWHEMCFKRRLGPWYQNAENADLHRSQYDDGKIGWARMPIRSQESFQRWIFNRQNQAIGLVQMPAPDYQARVIPRTKSLLFRPGAHKDNPEGRSILRNAYRPWFYKKRIEETEATGVDRDLTGLPIAKVPASVLGAKPGSAEHKKLAGYRALVRGVRRDERDGVIMPLEYDGKGNPLYDFGLLTSGGSRQFDTNGIITRYESRILMTVLADFILVGHEGTGTYNMHADKRGLFQSACNSIVKLIADELNRQAIPKLFMLNGMKPARLPKFVPGKVDSPNLTELSSFMSAMQNMGVQWFPDPKMEKWVRDAADMPAMDKEVEEVLEVQHQQATVMQLAQQRLQALQIGQQAQQGQMQMEQAQQQADMSAQQGAMQMEGQAMQLEGQRRELEAPGSTQPQQGAPSRGPARKKPAGRKSGSSNRPQRKAAAR